jgi:ATP/ADP translocase
MWLVVYVVTCHVLQSLKDSIMVTAGGAEVLPFLASCCVLPASVAFFVLYGKLVSGVDAAWI